MFFLQILIYCFFAVLVWLERANEEEGGRDEQGNGLNRWWAAIADNPLAFRAESCGDASSTDCSW